MLEEYMLGIGFSEEEIPIIRTIYPANIYTESTLLFNFKNLYNFFRRNGIDNQSFHTIVMTIPSIISTSIENIKIRIQDLNNFGFNKLDSFKIIKSYPYILEISNQKIKNKMDKLHELGFPKNNIIQLVTDYSIIFSLESSSIKKKYLFFVDYGYSSKQAIDILTKAPSLFDAKIHEIEKHLDAFKDMGFSHFDIIKFTSILPELILNPLDLMQKKLHDLLDFGYSEMDIIYIIKKVPIILKERFLEEVNSRIDCLSSLGFLKNNIITMTCNNPYIFLYSNDNLTNKFMGIQNCHYSVEEAIEMIQKFPILFGYDMNSIQEKIEFYHSLELDQVIVHESYYLFYSLELIQARYHYLLSQNEVIDSHNYRNLFLNDLDFSRKYHITREQLLGGVS